MALERLHLLSQKRLRLFFGAFVFLILGAAGVGIWFAVQGAPVTIDNSVSTSTASLASPSNKIVFTSDTVGYSFYIDSDNSCNYRKTTDGGATWATEVNNFDSVNTTDCIGVAVWYDRWTPGDTTGNYIHVATIDTSVDDIYYTRLDTSNDTKTTSVVTDTQAANLGSGAQNVTITKAINGVLYTGLVESTDTFFLACSATCTTAEAWTEMTTSGVTGADGDLSFLMPLADNDILAIWYDQSLRTIYWREYDETSGWLGSWAVVASTIVLNTTYDNQIALTQDLDSYLIYLVHGDDTANFSPGTNDVQSRTFDGSTWTLKTDVITNGSYGITGVSVAIDTNTDDIIVGITAQTQGLQTYSGAPFVYYSTDGMTTWEERSEPLHSELENLYGGHVTVSTGERVFMFWGDSVNVDLYGTSVWDAGSGVYTYLSVAGTQTAAFQNGTANQYLGGAFTLIRDSGSTTVSSITITDTGTINAGTYLTNLDLYYETTDTCTYNGDEALFGTDTAFSGGDIAVVEGSLTVGTSQICIYPVFDIASGGLGTIDLTINSPGTDILVADGGVPQLATYSVRGVSSTYSSSLGTQVMIDSTPSSVQGTGNSTRGNTVFISDAVGYTFYVDSDGSCNYRKTTDGGATWATEVNNFDSVNTTDCVGIGVWYDRWTPGDTTGNYIHVATIDSGLDDIYYTRLDTSNDTKTASIVTDTQAAAFGSTQTPSITKSTTGVLYTGIADATDTFFLRCASGCTVAEAWTEMVTSGLVAADEPITLMPDGEDIVVIWQDLSATTLFSREWDDSASAWAGAGWTTVATGFDNNNTTLVNYSVTLGAGSIYLAYIGDESNLGPASGYGDIVTYSYDGSTWSLKTEILTNDARQILRVSLGYDSANDTIYAVYLTVHPSDFNVELINYKASTDGMATWSSESAETVNTTLDVFAVQFYANVTSSERLYLVWKDEDTDDLIGRTIVDITSGSLGVDIVDAGGSTVASPSMSMSSATFSFAHQVITGIFGTSSQRIRVTNGTGASAWTLSLAPDLGATALWDGTVDYDFNDPTADAGDGGDADSVGGQMTVNAGAATVSPEAGCGSTGITLGSSSGFSQGVTDSITLASADGSADTSCYWDVTGVGISQTVPAEQPAGSYSIDMVLSIIAN